MWQREAEESSTYKMNPDVTSDTQEWHARKRKNQTDANQQRQGDLDRIKSIVELERKIH